MESDALSAAFAALADPTRRAIVARLARGDATVKELSAPFALSAPAISKHLRVLERAGLISQGREKQWRPCRLEAEPLKAVFDWTASYRRFWEESFDRLDVYLAELQAGAPAKGHPEKRKPSRRASSPSNAASSQRDERPGRPRRKT